MVQRQGGDVSYLDHPEQLPCAPAYAVQAEQDGFVAAMQTEEIGAVAGMLGAGRERKEDKVDPAAGIRFVKRSRSRSSEGRRLLSSTPTAPTRWRRRASAIGMRCASPPRRRRGAD